MIVVTSNFRNLFCLCATAVRGFPSFLLFFEVLLFLNVHLNQRSGALAYQQTSSVVNHAPGNLNFLNKQKGPFTHDATRSLLLKQKKNMAAGGWWWWWCVGRGHQSLHQMKGSKLFTGSNHSI